MPGEPPRMPGEPPRGSGERGCGGGFRMLLAFDKMSDAGSSAAPPSAPATSKLRRRSTREPCVRVLHVWRVAVGEGGRARAGCAREGARGKAREGRGLGVACRAPAARARAEPCDPPDGREREDAHAARAR